MLLPESVQLHVIAASVIGIATTAAAAAATHDGRQAGEDDKGKAEQQQHRLDNTHAPLQHHLIRQQYEARADNQHLLLRLLALAFELEHGRLPYLIVLLPLYYSK
jgi:hypothetical protein